ncbi:MAG: rhomboid family intramembrane serine protease [Gemmiger sp.]|nr:rhomboid family intramembrane serine protease [Gemmiger sp.]
MRWIDKLERKYGRYGIPNLINIILGGQILAWVLIMFINKDLYSLLTLTRTGLLHGQIWRLVSFLFVPTLTPQIFSLILEIYFSWWIGNALTRAWGDFRFTVYLLAGVLGAVVSCLIAGSATTSGLFLSLFFAYAWMWPDQQVLLFFILPIKMKWLGWVALATWVVRFLVGGVAAKLCLVFGLAGFLLFFGPELWYWCRTTLRDYKRRRDWNNRMK